MKICKECKTINDDSAKFCRSCGNAFEKKTKGETIGTFIFWLFFIGGIITCGILGLPLPVAIILEFVFIGLGVWVSTWFQ